MGEPVHRDIANAIRAGIVRSSPDRLSRSWWSEGKAIQDHDTGGRLCSVNVIVEEAPASEDIAEALGVPPGAAVLTRARRFAIEDRIVQTATSYIPLDVVAAVPAVAYTSPRPGGMYARMAEAGIGPETFRERRVNEMVLDSSAYTLEYLFTA